MQDGAQEARPRRGHVMALVVVGLLGAAAAGVLVVLVPSSPVPAAVMVLAAAVAAGSLAAAARRRGPGRRAWLLIAVFALLAAPLHVATLGGVTDSFAGQVVRAALAVTVVVGVLSFPGVARQGRGWAILLLDGWLVGGALLTALWLAVAATTRLDVLLTTRPAVVVWLGVNLVVCCVMIGLAYRVPPGCRVPAAMLAAGAALVAVADFYWVVLGLAPGSLGRAAYLAGWTAAAVVTASCPWWSRRTPYERIRPERRGRGAMRLPYLAASVAIAAGVLAPLTGRAGDPVLVGCVLLLLLGMLLSQGILARENAELYRHVAAQAEEFRVQATRDALTGLPNRREFTGHVQRALDGPGRGQVAVVFIDLDGFKHVNDTFGHDAGDRLLTETATRLADEVRGDDVVARFGGDEFVALLADCTDAQAAQIAERLRSTLARPYRVEGRDIVVSASIGLARAGTSDDAHAALRNADLALYRAKEQGRDRVATYHPDMHRRSVRRLGGEAVLRRALAEDRLTLSYQPIVDLRTGRLHALEALLRFDEADLPGWDVSEVIRTAEDSGLMVPLGRWVVEAATRQLGQWRTAGHTVRVAVNVSARQLEHDELVPVVERELDRHGLTPDQLVLEVTEHELVHDLERGARVLAQLRARGLRVVLDDFGTGYSSLAYLPQLPLDGLKIDRQLVARAGGVRDIVPAVLRLARDLGLTVVAEGVETLDQLLVLRSSGCVLGQGYLLGRPADAAGVTELVATGRVPSITGDGTSLFVPDPETAGLDA